MMLGRLLDESTIPGSLLSVYVVEESRDPIEVHELALYGLCFLPGLKEEAEGFSLSAITSCCKSG
jgi:hypothetical protein